MGDTLFFSDYLYSSRGKIEKTYSITTNPNMIYEEFDSCGDHTTGFTNMMIVNGDTVPGSIVWKQLVENIKPATDYEFSFWFTSINDRRPAILIVIFNQDTLKPYPIYMRDSSCYWQNMTYKWNSGSNDTVEIKIYDIALHFLGNDFALDDISFMEYCRVQACAGQNLWTCKDKPVMLTGNAEDGFLPYRYLWSPAAGLDNPNSQFPTAVISQTQTYVLQVTDGRDCISFDTVTVNVYDEPDNTITASHQMPVCPCEQVTLSAPPGYKYLWSTGETTPSIIVTNPNTYSVEISDVNGCNSTGSFELIHKPTSVTMFADSISEKTGMDIEVFLRYIDEKNILECDYTSFTAKIKYNASILVPQKDTPFGVINNGFETITISGNLKDIEINPLRFFTVWGNTECTDIEIEQISFNCDSVNIGTISGQVCLNDLCDANGLRLFENNGSSLLKSSITDDVLNINLILDKDRRTSLKLYDYMGRTLHTFVNKRMGKGIYQYQFPVSNISKSMYYIVLKIDEYSYSQPILIY